VDDVPQRQASHSFCWRVDDSQFVFSRFSPSQDLIADLLFLTDMHEIGIVSGFAAAYRLGAKYPFTEDKDCKRLFALYLAASHGSRMVRLLMSSVRVNEAKADRSSPLQRSEDREGFFR